MDEEIRFRRVTRGIVHVDKTNCGTPSFDLGFSQLDSDNAGFMAELEEDKLKTETRRKSGNDHVNIRNSMSACSNVECEISVVDEKKGNSGDDGALVEVVDINRHDRTIISDPNHNEVLVSQVYKDKVTLKSVITLYAI
ncbi:hypothetical protein FXO38_22049 [Capsicum annuum]|nr:hypothetical protein FXO37_30826 [Capsicum annuum]KAF3640627.1 hypothetical protein FXO38_22049 [Capsicum annuum]